MNDVPNVNGLFLGQAQVSSDLKGLIRMHLNQRRKMLAADQMEAIDMICTSVAAAINGDADNVQHWQAMNVFTGVVIERLTGTGQYKELAEKLAALREQEAKEQAAALTQTEAATNE